MSNYNNQQPPQSTFAPQEQQYGGAQPQGYAGARGSGIGQQEPRIAAGHQGGFANASAGDASTQQGFAGHQQGAQGQTGQYNPSHGTGFIGTAAEPGSAEQGQHHHQHGEHDPQRKHSPLSDLKDRLPRRDENIHSLDGVGGGYGAGVAGKHDGLPFIKHNDTSSHDPTLEHQRDHHHHRGQHEAVGHQQGGGVGAGLGAGIVPGHGQGVSSTTATPGHEHGPTTTHFASGETTTTANDPVSHSSPNTTTSQGNAPHKPSFLDKAIGGAEIAVGKVTKDTSMIEEGQARKTGVQTHNAAALGKEGSHAYGVEGEEDRRRETERRAREEAPRGAAGLGGTKGVQGEGLGRDERQAFSAGGGGI
ncbi:hypothetical protein BCR35DRAFT_308149 [Leucosporidium creatinivorum]|uniref:Uncharacterized protein n=1 Tax=Leucosporidium creatinivorum TaxID=106004 RepID=A0A1Y2EEB1_9BASI|nr:hypothetical protein BCR35DRAFT_308149 [Leucosporidium creatinivorum]